VAKYKKKRVRELQHDRFRDTTMGLLERLGDKLEGKGRTILYGVIGLVLLAVLAGFYVRWSNRKENEARRALGRAITIATTPVSATPSTDPSTPTYPTERERAQRAVEEFQKVSAKYGDPYRAEARYFAATNLLQFDRPRGISELTELTKSGNSEVATLSKFALGQAKESDGSLDEAAQLYRDIAGQNSLIVTPEVANLRLALVYDKQGKKKEAADILFNIVEASRKAKDSEGLPETPSPVASEAAKQLEKIDAARYAQLTPQAPRTDLPF
jgi:hypothetical protein